MLICSRPDDFPVDQAQLLSCAALECEKVTQFRHTFVLMWGGEGKEWKFRAFCGTNHLLACIPTEFCANA